MDRGNGGREVEWLETAVAPIVREAKVFGLLNVDDGAFTHEFSEKRRLRRVGDGASVD